MEQMKTWDGKDESGKYQYTEDEIKSWNMMIDSKGNIWYTTHETPPRTMIWCTVNKLTRHLHRLEQLKERVHRETLYKLKYPLRT
jgi:hypothetical protein